MGYGHAGMYGNFVLLHSYHFCVAVSDEQSSLAGSVSMVHECSLVIEVEGRPWVC